MKLIVALDVDSLREARRFVRLLIKETRLFKVGLGLFTVAGPDAVRMVQDEGGEVFLDLKFHDIPNTVAKACESAASLGLFMLNLHASGGREMLKAAAESVRKVRKPPLLLGVTVLTSQKSRGGLTSEVAGLATLCRGAGLDGVICSPNEIQAVKKRCGKDFVVVTPGIRPSGTARGDQRRVATPAEAVRRGADYIVVGRPVLQALDPLRVVQSILSEMTQR